MVVVEVLLGVFVCCFAAVVFAAAVVGLMGSFGLLRLARCDRCGHLAVSSGAEAPGSCPYCRQGILLHPVHALHDTFFHPLAHLHQIPSAVGHRRASGNGRRSS